MNLPCRWEILLMSLWILVGFVPEIHCKDGNVAHLSREDVLLLKDEQNPKCFTRTQRDFTCFCETADNRTYDLFYWLDGKRRCEMFVQRTEEGTFLNIWSFPEEHVRLYFEIHIEVVECSTNNSLYKRDIFVQEHVLLDPLFNVSLHQNGQVGQLQVSWHSNVSIYMADSLMYRIRYASNGLGERIKEAKEGATLESLVPGDEIVVQVTVKFAINPNEGHWSRWSNPVRAMVPQSADDISLMCYTSDLQNITCQWNGSRYGIENKCKLFYKMGLSEALGWTEWTECIADRNLTDLCHFHGDKSRKVRVRLSSTQAPLSRTFYTQEFTLHKSIKTAPPSHLRIKSLEKDKLCLTWKAPLPSLSAHLQYEVGYQIRKGEAWMTVSLKDSKTNTCLEVPMGSQYSVKFRSKPIYSGHWSEWSDVLTGDVPIDRDKLLLLFIPFSMLITAIILILYLRTFLSKLKLYIWPPVPDLDKVLQGFLTEVNGQKWNHLVTAKQCSEEIISSVVEIMSEDEVSRLGKPSEESSQLPSPERGFSSMEQIDGSPGSEVFPDYVTLNKDSAIHCPKGNKYVCEQFGEKEGLAVMEEPFQTRHSSCTDCYVCSTPSLDFDFLNHSYLPPAKPADRFNCKVNAARGPGNLYTNFPCS